MKRTAGGLIVFLFATLTFIANAAGDETSHAAHLWAAYGPRLACGACHDETGLFLDNQDLANTTVCNTCHSPGGTYNGVNSVNGSVGAKDNWDNIYSNGELAAGKEKWCVGCHDNAPSVVNGVSAPNIAGSESGKPYGFYITGHGKHGYEQAITCLTCHGASRGHVDGDARTYTAAAKNYQAGFRLKSVNGKPPLDVPRTASGAITDKFLLCFSCHDSTPFLTKENTDTNFRSDVDDACIPRDPAGGLVNKHWYHLQASNAFKRWDSDWDGAADSLISCTACHNVHGPRLKNDPKFPNISHAPAMIRTGEEMGRPSSLNLDYLVNSCPDWNTHSPTNELSGSTGGVMKFQGPARGSIAKNHVCIECHNEYQPYFREVKEIISCEKCHDSGSHVAHLTATYGPHVSCDACHDLNNIPLFSDGKNLAETHVCDTCHSPGGTYDGINDPVVGAKPNWASGVYYGPKLMTGKEKWCATCHDELPSVIDSVSAPNVVGDEGASTNYGVGYGYYKTGHGLPANKTFPESGGTISGAGLSCGYCHDLAMKHIDGVARTYAYNAAEGSDNDYQHGYRLKSIDGLLPMDMPRIDGCESGVEAADFRLCFKCHNSGPFRSPSNYYTNFRTASTNAHYYHLAIQDNCGYGPVFQSDWDASHSRDSRASCITCHNVHGSEQLSMVRDGKLVGRTGLEVLYYRPGVSYNCFQYPDSRNVPLNESTGTIWAQNNGLCATCHGSCGLDSVYLRTPFDNTPPRITKVQGQAGSNLLAVSFSEGVYSDQGASGALVATDFAFTDIDDGREIVSVDHTAGNDTASLTLDSALDGTGDIGVDTLAAATTASIYDGNNHPMGTTPAIISNANIATQLIIHPSGLASAANCSSTGGAWADILDSNDGDSTYADCFARNVGSGPSPEYSPARVTVDMDDPGLSGGAIINQLAVHAVVKLAGLTGGGGPAGPVAYLQICYDTGGTGQECSVRYDLAGNEGYVDIVVGNIVDPDGGPLDLNDLNNLRVAVKLDAEQCCGDSNATAYVTEVSAEIDYIVLADDADPPVISNQVPANGTIDVRTYSNLTFTLTDSGSGIDWNTFKIQFTGNKGYARLYADTDFTIVSKTGVPARYEVRVNPDADFGEREVITVTVSVDDFYGNTLVPPTWSFTTGTAPVPQTITLHPSGAAAAGGYTLIGGTWANVLDSNDGDASRVQRNGGPGSYQDFIVDMDDPGLSGAEIILGFTVYVYARHTAGGGPEPLPSLSYDMDIGYGTTGGGATWKGSTTTNAGGSDYTLISLNSSGSFTVTDINNLQVYVRRIITGSPMLRVTEVKVAVTYLP